MAFVDVYGEVLIEELVENENRAEIKLHQRRLRDASDPFQLPERLFKSIFRFKKDVARIIIDLIEPYMVERQRESGIPLHLKVLGALHFYGSGGYQLPTGQSYNLALSQPSMSRAINEVTNIIYNHLLVNWIIFPNTRNTRNKIIDGFSEKYNFLRCIGAIDCTHVAIISPPEYYPALPYYCRKGYYSINCQIIVDSDYNILNMNARFPRSTHDSAIWQASNIKNVMETNYIRGENCFLIGDSGYPLQPFLLTPFENPAENTPESSYNYSFIRARNIIEKLNGVLKSRFRCLSQHRVLNYDPIKVGKIIYSCGVLHNIARYYKDDLPEEEIAGMENEVIQVYEDNLLVRDENWHRRGQQVRNEIVQQYFNV